MKARALLCAVFLLSISSFARAEITYTYAQAVHQIYSETDTYLWELRGSYQIHDNLYVSMEDQNLRGAGTRSGHVGIFSPMENGMHLYGELGVADYTPDLYPVLEGGIRFEANGDFEIRGAVRIEPEMPVGAGDTGETFLIGEALFHLDKADLVGGLVLPNELDGSVLRLGARVSF
jgi:hypothetical protein